MKDYKESKAKEQKRGLYFALAVCLLAVAVAGSATYTSVMDYVKEQNEDSQLSHDEDNFDDDLVENEVIPNEIVEPDPEEFTVDIPEEFPQEDNPVVENPTITNEDEQSQNVAQESQMYSPSQTLIYPTKQKEIVKDFSDGELVFSETMGDYRSHCGADFYAEKGETISAAGNGIVLSTETTLLFGNTVTIEHGDYTVKYCGLGDTFIVNEGDIVVQGTPIGSASTVPCETLNEPHIHIEITKNGEYLNPVEILTQ